MLPFSRDQFVALFAQYNQAIWPAQWVAAAIGLVAVVALWRRTARTPRVVNAALAAMWFWTGAAYHGMFFTRINVAAWGFATLFVVQGALFLRAAFAAPPAAHGTPNRVVAGFGWALVVYAALLYPLVGWLAGHAYPEMPMFGVTPCPVTLFTFGALLIDPSPLPRYRWVIPTLWAVIGGSAAFLLGIVQDWPLLVGGLAAAVPLWRRSGPLTARAAWA